MERLFVLILLFFTFKTIGQSKLGETSLENNHTRKVAIIIGNQKYTAPGFALKKTHNDADSMKNKLQQMGFEILVFDKDLNKLDFYRKFELLENSLKNVNVLFFYYSGHGSEYQGENYFLPIDMPELLYNIDIKTHGIPMSHIYEVFNRCNINTKIIVTDACRSLPYGKGNSLRGMVKPNEIAKGTYSIFATRSGKIAFENPTGSNSFFTQELLKNLPIPGLSINQIYYQTKQSVLNLTKNNQEPSVLDELDGEFKFLDIFSSISNENIISLTKVDKAENNFTLIKKITIALNKINNFENISEIAPFFCNRYYSAGEPQYDCTNSIVFSEAKTTIQSFERIDEANKPNTDYFLIIKPEKPIFSQIFQNGNNIWQTEMKITYILYDVFFKKFIKEGIFRGKGLDSSKIISEKRALERAINTFELKIN